MLNENQMRFLYNQLQNEKPEACEDLPCVIEQIERYFNTGIFSMNLRLWGSLRDYLRNVLDTMVTEYTDDGAVSDTMEENCHRIFVILDDIETYPLAQEMKVAEGDFDIGELFED